MGSRGFEEILSVSRLYPSILILSRMVSFGSLQTTMNSFFNMHPRGYPTIIKTEGFECITLNPSGGHLSKQPISREMQLYHAIRVADDILYLSKSVEVWVIIGYSLATRSSRIWQGAIPSLAIVFSVQFLAIQDANHYPSVLACGYCSSNSTYFMMSVATPLTISNIPSTSFHVLRRFLDIFNTLTPTISW